MNKNCYSYIYTFDLIGANPQLLIFNNRRYKTLFSSITSIIIIIFSIIFSIMSLIDFLKYENPIIVYSKDNDPKTKRNIFIKDTLLMFQLVDTKNSEPIDNSIAYYKADYSIMYDNGTFYNEFLEIEECEVGKNLNKKFIKYFEDKYTFGREIKDFYCINLKQKDLSLFYYPKVGYSYIKLYVIYRNNTKYIPEKIQSLIVSEYDLIDNNNKHNPISPNFEYTFSTAFNSHEYTKINFYFQYIKYESDDGLFYKNSKISKGASFSDMTNFNTIDDNVGLKGNYDSEIALITLSINKSNFDNYKRSYPRFQSLLADVMSVISLLFEIGRQISLFLCEKKMSKDIIRNFFNKNNNYILNYENNNNINKKYINSEKTSERNSMKNIKTKIKEDITGKNILKIDKITNEEENDYNNNKNKKINDIFKKINYYHIFKSIFCFKDKKSQLIDICHQIISEDLCIERIIERLINLEMAYNLLDKDNENNFKLIKNNRFNELINFISNLDFEIKIDSLNKENKFK